jgi:hypothetical protein
VVVVLLRAPQAPAAVLPQLIDHVTPALDKSLLTVAVRAAVPLTPSEVGAPESTTESTTIGKPDEADLRGSVTEVAVIVTRGGTGAVAGAV